MSRPFFHCYQPTCGLLDDLLNVVLFEFLLPANFRVFKVVVINQIHIIIDLFMKFKLIEHYVYCIRIHKIQKKILSRYIHVIHTYRNLNLADGYLIYNVSSIVGWMAFGQVSLLIILLVLPSSLVIHYLLGILPSTCRRSFHLITYLCFVTLGSYPFPFSNIEL